MNDNVISSLEDLITEFKKDKNQNEDSKKAIANFQKLIDEIKKYEFR